MRGDSQSFSGVERVSWFSVAIRMGYRTSNVPTTFAEMPDRCATSFYDKPWCFIISLLLHHTMNKLCRVLVALGNR